MRLLDRYMLKEFVSPFLFGLGSFAVMVIGALIAPMLLDLMIRKGFPPSVVLQLFVCRMPQVVMFALPMAMIFGSVMTIATLTGTGELVAVRAGGASLWRLAMPILVTGFCVALANVALHEAVSPASLDAAWRVQVAQLRKMRPLEDIKWEVPSGQPTLRVWARRFDPQRQVLSDLLIVEKHKQGWQTLTAREAEWGGGEWVLRDVTLTTTDADGNQTRVRASVRLYDIGRDPDELEERPVKLDEMSLAQLRRELAKRRRFNTPLAGITQVIQYMYTESAKPWIPFFFAFVGIPLGMRPTRASTGIGLGLSLVVSLAYFILLHSMHLVGQTGAIPSVVAAWLPNGVLLGTGLVLFAHAGR